MIELLEATKNMTRYFKKSYKHNKTQHNSTDSHHPVQAITIQLTQTNTNTNRTTPMIK